MTIAGKQNFDDFKLKISSKKLLSGKHQVRFELEDTDEKEIYGYLLAEPKSTLNEVVEKIMGQVYLRREKDMYFHGHLYSMPSIRKSDEVMIFEK